MAISGVPPRPVAPSLVPQEPTQPKPQAEAPAAPPDQMQKGPAQPKLAGAALPLGMLPGQELAQPAGEGHLAAFSALSGQIGDVPPGASVAPAFDAELPLLSGRAGIASLGFTPEQIGATGDLLALIDAGKLELPRETETALRETHALMTQPLTAQVLDAQVQKLGPNERAAFEALAAKLGGLFGGMARASGGAPKRSNLAALRKGSTRRLSVLPGLEDLEGVEPPELRELLIRARRGAVDRVERDQGHGESGGGDEERSESERAAGPKPRINPFPTLDGLDSELQALALDAHIVLPDEALIAIESVLLETLPSLANVDAARLADLLTYACALGAEQELGRVLDEARQLALTHKQACAAHAQLASSVLTAEAALRKRFDERRALTTGHPAALPSDETFDRYCDEQMLWLVRGALGTADPLELRLSPREPRTQLPQAPPQAAEIALGALHNALAEAEARAHGLQETLDGFSSTIEFHLERRESFSMMTRAMIAHAQRRQNK